MTKYRLIRHRTFAIENAKASIWFSLETEKTNIFGRTKWVSVKIPFWDGLGTSMSEAVGDKKWAERIAKEYKIKVPKI